MTYIYVQGAGGTRAHARSLGNHVFRVATDGFNSTKMPSSDSSSCQEEQQRRLQEQKHQQQQEEDRAREMQRKEAEIRATEKVRWVGG